jgi:hypothetical protein
VLDEHERLRRLGERRQPVPARVVVGLQRVLPFSSCCTICSPPAFGS